MSQKTWEQRFAEAEAKRAKEDAETIAAIEAARYKRPLPVVKLDAELEKLRKTVYNNDWQQTAGLVIYVDSHGEEMGIGELRTQNAGFNNAGSVPASKFQQIAKKRPALARDIGHPYVHPEDNKILQNSHSLMVSGVALETLKAIFATMPERVFQAPPSLRPQDDSRTGGYDPIPESARNYEIIDRALYCIRHPRIYSYMVARAATTAAR